MIKNFHRNKKQYHECQILNTSSTENPYFPYRTLSCHHCELIKLFEMSYLKSNLQKKEEKQHKFLAENYRAIHRARNRFSLSNLESRD